MYFKMEKTRVILYLAILLLYIKPHANETQIYKNSKVGDYHTEWKEFGACPKEQRGNDEFYTDLRLSRKNKKLEVVGNTTLLVPFDDTFTINVNFAILGSNSAWLPNAYNLPIARACTTMINLLKEGWTEYLRTMNASTKCPIPKGIYIQKGYDLQNFVRNSVLPKQFIFGSYKVTIQYIKKKILRGCTYFVMEVIPAWQKAGKQSR